MNTLYDFSFFEPYLMEKESVDSEINQVSFRCLNSNVPKIGDVVIYNGKKLVCISIFNLDKKKYKYSSVKLVEPNKFNEMNLENMKRKKLRKEKIIFILIGFIIGFVYSFIINLIFLKYSENSTFEDVELYNETNSQVPGDIEYYYEIERIYKDEFTQSLYEATKEFNKIAFVFFFGLALNLIFANNSKGEISFFVISIRYKKNIELIEKIIRRVNYFLIGVLISVPIYVIYFIVYSNLFLN